MSYLLRRSAAVLLFLTLIACGQGTSNPPGSTAVATPSSTIEPTATPAPMPTPTKASTPTAAFAAPIGLERLADPTGDVEDARLAPVPDAPSFVDLSAASLEINSTNLLVTIETAGPIPQALDPGDEMTWSLEISPPDPASLTLYRVSETLSGGTWSATNFDFERDGRAILAKVHVHDNMLSISFPLAEFPKIDGPFRWWVAALWNRFDAGTACGDRIPDGDPVWFPPDAQPVVMTWEEIPEQTAPAGLGSVQLPTDDASAAALLARMPAEIAGLSRQAKVAGQTGVRRMVYGAENETLFPPMSLMAIDAADPFTDWPPGTTGRDVVELFTSGFDIIDDAGREGNLGWVRLHVRESLENGSTRVSQAILWADADSHWYFAAEADTREHLDALLAAFVAAARAGE